MKATYVIKLHFGMVVFLALLAGLMLKPSARTLATAAPNLAKHPAPHRMSQAVLAKNYGKLPLSFEANAGQSNPQVKFLSRGPGYALFLTSGEAVLALEKSDRRAPAYGPLQNPNMPPAELGAAAGQHSSHGAENHVRSNAAARAVVRMKVLGASAEAKVIGLDELPGKINYFLGKDPQKWRTNVPTYARVQYHGVYRGIDLVYHGNRRQLEYDFVVAPGADPRTIKLAIAATPRTRRHASKSPLAIDAAGDLTIQTNAGEIRFHKPGVYQQAEKGRKHFLAARYSLNASKGIVSFNVARYDHSRPLVIDPVLVFSTYLGGADGDYGNGIAVDSAYNVYVTGTTYSTDFPVQGPLPAPYNSLQAPTAAFVTKLNATGTALVYSTYLGGNVVDGTGVGIYAGHAIAVDALGDAYVAGVASGPSNFPTTAGAYQTACKLTQAGYCLTAFLSKLSPSGNMLMYSTYIGGSGGTLEDTPYSLAVDSSGNAYVTGETYSSDFPTTEGAFQPTQPDATLCTVPAGATTCLSSPIGCSNSFAVKINAAGSAALYSTYLGGACASDTGHGIAVDSSGNAYIAGVTTPSGTSTDPSANFPTTVGALQSSPAGTGCSGGLPCADAFIAKLKPDGSGLVYSSLLGGTGLDIGLGVALDAAGDAFLTAETTSDDFPTMNPFQSSISGIPDAFVAKLNPAGNALVYSTYLGGTNGDYGTAIAVDPAGSAYVAGVTSSTDFPTLNPTQAANGGGSDAFLTELNPTGDTLTFSTYLGGTAIDAAEAIVLDSLGNAYIAGSTTSADFPTTPGAFQAQAPTPNCVIYPSGYIPFSSVTSTTGGLLIGTASDTAFTTLSSIPTPAFTNETFCGPVELAPGRYFNAYVPTAEERLGDFSSFSSTAPIIDPETGVQFLGNMIPPALLGPGGVFAWPINAPSVSNSDVFVAKVGSTPQALIGGLQNSVNSLDSAGTLNTGQSNALLAKLNAALASVNSGGASPATIHQLGAFIHQVQGLVLGGVLTSAEGEALINEANGIIAELGL